MPFYILGVSKSILQCYWEFFSVQINTFKICLTGVPFGIFGVLISNICNISFNVYIHLQNKTCVLMSIFPCLFQSTSQWCALWYSKWAEEYTSIYLGMVCPLEF